MILGIWERSFLFLRLCFQAEKQGGKTCSSLSLQASSLKGQEHKEETQYRIIFVIGFLHTGLISTLDVTSKHRQTFPIPQVSSTFVGLSISFLDFVLPVLLFSLIFPPLFLSNECSKNQSIQLWILCLVKAFPGHPFSYFPRPFLCNAASSGSSVSVLPLSQPPHILI